MNHWINYIANVWQYSIYSNGSLIHFSFHKIYQLLKNSLKSEIFFRTTEDTGKNRLEKANHWVMIVYAFVLLGSWFHRAFKEMQLFHY